MPNPIEEIASEAGGKIGAAAARAKGLTGIFNKLAEQHSEVSALLKRADMSSDPEKRRDLWGKIRKELLSHERSELREVYPVLQNYEATRPIVQQHSEEAEQLEATIMDLDGIDYASPAWGSTLKTLIELVQQHVDEEEDDFFPRAQDAMGKDMASAIESRYLEAQQSIKDQLG